MNTYRGRPMTEEAPQYYADNSLPPHYSPNENAIPDTEDLPPPPSIWYQSSPAYNADSQAAARARTWTNAHPLLQPQSLKRKDVQKVDNGLAVLVKPRDFAGDIIKNSTSSGCWSVRTRADCKDTCLMSDLPLHSGNNRGFTVSSVAPRYCYFEVRVHRLDPEGGIAIGLAAMPYPLWRLPGWDRASLAVHSDDGRRYVNDSAGGRDFTRPFRPLDVYGIGMKFAAPRSSSGRANSIPYADIQVIFTKNGAMEGTWNLHEEIDSEMDQPGGVNGLEGDHDLYASIGVFGSTAITVIFGKDNWAFKPDY